MAGVWHKTIILPEFLFAETSEDVLTTAIGHEMAHVARHDFALNLLYELLYLAVSFHPAAWIIRREIERTREMACDELVIRQLMDPGAYARSIMSIAVAMMEVPNNLAINPGNTTKFARPVVFVMRPGNPGRLVRLPFRRHAIAELGGTRKHVAGR